MQIILNSTKDIDDFYKIIDFKALSASANAENQTEEPKVDIKPTAEKTKKTKVEDKSKVEDKKEETPKVEAEVTEVDTNSTELPKDAEIKEENAPDEVTITKEMVREKFNAIVKSGKQKEAKQLIENLGVKKLSDVKPEDYATLIKEAEALL